MSFGGFRTFPLMAAFALTACMTVSTVQGEGVVETKIQGNWTVIHDGTARVELNPPAIVLFEAGSNRVSGFDGCNTFRGDYVFDGGLIKARLVSTRMACKDGVASAVSATLHKLFTQGAEVAEREMMGVMVLTLRNKSAGAELRMSSTEQLQKK